MSILDVVKAWFKEEAATVPEPVIFETAPKDAAPAEPERPGKTEDDGSLYVNLTIPTIRNGRDGTKYDVGRILAGKDALMARSKVRLDSGSNLEDPADEYEILWRFFANGKLCGFFKASEAIDNDVDVEMGPWVLGGQGIRQLEASKGHTCVVKFRGLGSGTGTAGVEVIHRGATSNRIQFPKAD